MASRAARLQRAVHHLTGADQAAARPDGDHRRAGRPRVETPTEGTEDRTGCPVMAGPVLHESDWDTFLDRAA